MEGPGGPASLWQASPGAVRTRGVEASVAWVVPRLGGSAKRGAAAQRNRPREAIAISGFQGGRCPEEPSAGSSGLNLGAEGLEVGERPAARGLGSTEVPPWGGVRRGRLAQERRRPCGRVPSELAVGERPGCGGPSGSRCHLGAGPLAARRGQGARPHPSPIPNDTDSNNGSY